MRLKSIIIFIAIVCFTDIVSAQHKRAFMVGVSHYDTEKTGYEWNDIHGKEDVQLLVPCLQKQGFKVVTVLDDKATHQNIITGLKNFVKTCKSGDIVYLHFSCHGQPFEDKNGDETDGWDEALVPVDAWKNYHKGKYEGKNHLLDDELKVLTDNIRKKIGEKGFLYVSIDACHAGTSARGENNTRGTMLAFTSNRNKIYNPPVDKKSTYKVNTQKGMSKVIFLEACRSDQINREVNIAGTKYGSLSYNVAMALKGVKLTNSPDAFTTALLNSIKQKGRWPNNQNLVIEKSY